MRRRLLFLLIAFAAWLPVLVIQKPMFMLYHHDLAGGCTAADWLRVAKHGLRLDSTIAGYLTIIPLLFTLASVWLPGKYLRKSLTVYFGIMATLVAMIFAADVALYTFWGFRMDATVFFYIQFPSGAMTSVPVGLLIRQVLFVIAYAGATTWMFCFVVRKLFPEAPAGRPLPATLILVLAGGLLFLPIRGSVTTSTANIGMVYFSDNQFLNHSAINPVFSLTTSLFKQQDFASQFQFFPEEKQKNFEFR
jgi:hypothetical protein